MLVLREANCDNYTILIEQNINHVFQSYIGFSFLVRITHLATYKIQVVLLSINTITISYAQDHPHDNYIIQTIISSTRFLYPIHKTIINYVFFLSTYPSSPQHLSSFFRKSRPGKKICISPQGWINQLAISRFFICRGDYSAWRHSKVGGVY